MILLTFTNPDSVNSVELKYVKTLEWETVAVDSVFVDKESRVGNRQRIIKIKGFLNHGLFDTAVDAQTQLESDLRSVGVGTLAYTDGDSFENMRFSRLSFDEYQGNPVANFTIEFTTDEDNIHAHTITKIGSLSLIPSNGFEQPSIKDSITVQGDDEQINELKSRAFTITGDIVAATLDEVMLAQSDLEDVVKDTSTFILTLSSSSSVPGIFTVRPRSLEFGSPKTKDGKTARSYSLVCNTHDDYSKEPYTLGEVATSFAGISIDVVTNVDHNNDFEFSNALAYTILSESIDVSGKKYFDNYAAYEAFRDLFRPIPTNTYFITSASNNVLELADISIGKMERDGNYSTDDSKRYSSSISLSFKWIPSIERSTYEHETTHFDVEWYKVENVSFGVSLDDQGNVKTRSVNVSGVIKTIATFDTLKDKIGTKVSYGGVYTDLYVGSVSVGNVEAVSIGGVEFQMVSCSVTATQLDTASQAFNFLTGVFDFNKAGAVPASALSGESFTFDKIGSRTKSISNRYDTQTASFIVTSINYSVSGEVFSSDSNGNPADQDKFVLLFNKVDALLSAQKSDREQNTQATSNILPTNANIHFFLTNINIGSWSPFVDESTGVRRWKQTVSLSATAVFDLSGSLNTQPDRVETRSESLIKQSGRYTQIQILNFGTVFKRIGTTPEKLTVTYQVRWKNEALYNEANLSGLTFGLDNVGEGSWAGSGKNEKTKDQQENRGLVNRHIVEYTANKKLS